MLYEGRRHVGTSFEPGLHQIDPAARRVHLLTPEDIRGTRWKTEAAVDTLINQCAGRLVGAFEHWFLVNYQLPTSTHEDQIGPLPAFRMFAGSSLRFSTRATSVAPDAVPQTSTCSFSRRVARRTTTCPTSLLLRRSPITAAIAGSSPSSRRSPAPLARPAKIVIRHSWDRRRPSHAVTAGRLAGNQLNRTMVPP